MTGSTESATPPESTKSRNLNFSVQIQITPNSRFEFVPWDDEESEIPDIDSRYRGFRGWSMFSPLFIHVTFLFTHVTVLWNRHRGKWESDEWLFDLCVPCFVQWFDTTYSYMWHYYSRIWQYYEWVIEGNQRKRDDSFIYMWHASFNDVIRLIHTCDITIHTCNSTIKEPSREMREWWITLSYVCDMTYSRIYCCVNSHIHIYKEWGASCPICSCRTRVPSHVWRIVLLYVWIYSYICIFMYLYMYIYIYIYVYIYLSIYL